MRTCTDVQAAFCSGTWRHRPGQSERGAYQSCKVCHGSEPASESWRYQQNTHGGVEDDFQQSSYFYPRMSRPQPMAKCRGGGEGVSVKAESPGRARRGPPTSPPALYKRARSSAARQWLLHAHKEGVLAPRETVPLRIATTRAFGSVDYPHCQVSTFFLRGKKKKKKRGRWRRSENLQKWAVWKLEVALQSPALALGDSSSPQREIRSSACGGR